LAGKLRILKPRSEDLPVAKTLERLEIYARATANGPFRTFQVDGDSFEAWCTLPSNLRPEILGCCNISKTSQPVFAVICPDLDSFVADASSNHNSDFDVLNTFARRYSKHGVKTESSILATELYYSADHSRLLIGCNAAKFVNSHHVNREHLAMLFERFRDHRKLHPDKDQELSYLLAEARIETPLGKFFTGKLATPAPAPAPAPTSRGCGNCGVAGHYRQTCPLPVNPEKKSRKRNRGSKKAPIVIDLLDLEPVAKKLDLDLEAVFVPVRTWMDVETVTVVTVKTLMDKLTVRKTVKHTLMIPEDTVQARRDSARTKTQGPRPHPNEDVTRQLLCNTFGAEEARNIFYAVGRSNQNVVKVTRSPDQRFELTLNTNN